MSKIRRGRNCRLEGAASPLRALAKSSCKEISEMGDGGAGAADLEGAASPLTALARSSPEEYSGVGDLDLRHTPFFLSEGEPEHHPREGSF